MSALWRGKEHKNIVNTQKKHEVSPTMFKDNAAMEITNAPPPKHATTTNRPVPPAAMIKDNPAMDIKLPRAQDWHKGMTICDPHGKVLFRVQEHYDDGTGLVPIYHCYFANRDGTVIQSIIEFRAGDLSGGWEIYTPTPRYPVQRHAIRLAGGHQHMGLHDLYLHAKVHSMYGRKKVTIVVGQDKEELLYTYKTSGGKCCGRGSSRRVFRFYHGEELLVTRDQTDETLTMAPGQDLLLAVSMAYALDRHIGLRPELVGFVRFG
jgi:hypothetical protein